MIDKHMVFQNIDIKPMMMMMVVVVMMVMISANAELFCCSISRCYLLSVISQWSFDALLGGMATRYKNINKIIISSCDNIL
jgi:Na+-transporting NADH:ubiquinone oxidoreductase subunit NqrB